MKHFTIWQLTDLARGLVEAGPTRSAMDTHLSGCPRCERIVTVLRGVSTTARAEAGYQPPEHAIRYAQAIYSLYGPEKISFPRMIARLVYDSARAPLPAGMRSQNRLSRHVLYETESYCLDVQLEHQPGSNLVSLTGQLADRSKPPTSTADLPVRLMKRKSLVTSTLSNRLGEFRLEYAPARNLRLQLPIPAVRQRLEVSLSQLYAGESGTKRPTKVASRHTGRKRGGK